MIEVLNQEFDDASGEDRFYDAEERRVWTREQIEAARSVATDAQRRILDVWMRLREPTWAEVARELGCSPGAVTTQIQRRKAKLGITVAKASAPSPAREIYRTEIARRKRRGSAG